MAVSGQLCEMPLNRWSCIEERTKNRSSVVWRALSSRNLVRSLIDRSITTRRPEVLLFSAATVCFILSFICFKYTLPKQWLGTAYAAWGICKCGKLCRSHVGRLCIRISAVMHRATCCRRWKWPAFLMDLIITLTAKRPQQNEDYHKCRSWGLMIILYH